MSDHTILTSPGDVAAAVPALIGFQPERSLVALWLSVPAGTLICTVRLDLDTPAVEVTRRLLDLAARVGPGRLLLVVYPESLVHWIDSAHESEVLEALDLIGDAGTEVSDLLVVAHGRYYSQLCTDLSCCPAGGQRVPTSTTVTEAELVSAGAPAVAASRDAVLARFALAPHLAPSAELLDNARADVPDNLPGACRAATGALQRLAITSAADGGAADLAMLMIGLQDVTVRDWVISNLATGSERALVDTLVRAALAAPNDLRPRIAGAAALYAMGDSSVGVWALVDHAGDDSLAGLVAASLDFCIPPTELRTVFADAAAVIQARLDADNDAVAWRHRHSLSHASPLTPQLTLRPLTPEVGGVRHDRTQEGSRMPSTPPTPP